MKLKKRLITVTIITILLTTTSSISSMHLEPYNASNILVKSSSSILDPFEENLTGLMKEAHTPGLSAIIIINDSVVWKGGYGYANIHKKINATPDTIYLGASISKTITATAIMQLWEKELFDLDDDVSDYLPFELRNPKYPEKKITFRMLLSHHSSIAYGDWKSQPLTYILFSLFGNAKDRYEELLIPSGTFYNPRIWIDSEPGEELLYSNIGYFLLEYLVELLSDQSFDAYVKENIFDPLEMNDTSYQLSNYNKDQLSRPYLWAFNTYIPIPHYEFGNHGVAGVRSSVNDLSNYLIAHMNGGVYKENRILNNKTIDLIRTIQFPDENNDNLWYQYGLGWRIIKRNESYVFWHPGNGAGVATYINYDPINRVGLIFCINQYPIIVPYDIMTWIDLLFLLHDKAYSYI